MVLALLRAYPEGSRLPLRLASLDLEGAALWAPALPILMRHAAAARSWVRGRGTAAGLGAALLAWRTVARRPGGG